MDETLKLNLMRETIVEAEKSRAEDHRNHPLVGALVTDDEGKVLVRAHRGENGSGGHAEYLLFQKAQRENVDLNGKTLFVTLEPCTRRGAGKVPCAVRVANSGVKRVYIGTIDPNPAISGRGELYLVSRGLEVERFPFSLSQELLAKNKDFFDDYTHYSAPAVAIDDIMKELGSGKLPGNREAILQASLDLMISSSGPIEIFSGGSSWVRELQVGLLHASLAGREIRILCEQDNAEEPKFKTRMGAAIASGAHVGVTQSPMGIRGTLASPNTDSATVISVERLPTLHGVKLSSPHEKGLLTALATLFDQQWKDAKKFEARPARILSLEIDHVSAILKQFVPPYRSAVFRIADVPIAGLRLLSRNMERFKLFRVAVLEDLISKNGLPQMGCIEGSIWPYLLPFIEVSPDGGHTVIDGAHRVYHALQRRNDTIRAVLIESVTEPLPSTPMNSLDEIKVTSDKWPRDERYIDFKPQHFRGIREAFERALRPA